MRIWYVRCDHAACNSTVGDQTRSKSTFCYLRYRANVTRWNTAKQAGWPQLLPCQQKFYLGGYSPACCRVVNKSLFPPFFYFTTQFTLASWSYRPAAVPWAAKAAPVRIAGVPSLEHGLGPQPSHLRRGVSLYNSIFSRTVWRLYCGAKGLVMWYYIPSRRSRSSSSAPRAARGPASTWGDTSPSPRRTKGL